jgi:hypothetical protein
MPWTHVHALRFRPGSLLGDGLVGRRGLAVRLRRSLHAVALRGIPGEPLLRLGRISLLRLGRVPLLRLGRISLLWCGVALRRVGHSRRALRVRAGSAVRGWRRLVRDGCREDHRVAGQRHGRHVCGRELSAAHLADFSALVLSRLALVGRRRTTTQKKKKTKHKDISPEGSRRLPRGRPQPLRQSSRGAGTRGVI